MFAFQQRAVLACQPPGPFPTPNWTCAIAVLPSNCPESTPCLLHAWDCSRYPFHGADAPLGLMLVWSCKSPPDLPGFSFFSVISRGEFNRFPQTLAVHTLPWPHINSTITQLSFHIMVSSSAPGASHRAAQAHPPNLLGEAFDLPTSTLKLHYNLKKPPSLPIGTVDSWFCLADPVFQTSLSSSRIFPSGAFLAPISPTILGSFPDSYFWKHSSVL